MTGTEANLLQALRESGVIYDEPAVDRLLAWQTKERRGAQSAALRSAAADWPDGRGIGARAFNKVARTWLAARADRIDAETPVTKGRP